jgi:peptidyl-prolyl cis-trans isomerase C
MRISFKVIVLIVCALAGMVFCQGCQEGAKTTVKPALSKAEGDANTAAREVKVAAPAEKKAVVPAEPTPGAPGKPAAPAPVISAGTSGGNETAVTVNGNVITEAEVDAKIKPNLDRIARQMDPNVASQYAGRLRAQATAGMIIERLLDEEVKKAGITVTDNDVNSKISEITAQQGMTIDALKSLLAMQGQTFEQFEQQMRKGLGYEKLVDRQIGKVDINDAEALAFYKENEADYNTPEQVKASHILIKPDPNIVDVNEAKAKASAKAKDLLKQVKAGADFATLAKENSDCPSKVKGGDLGFFERGSMVPEFEDAAFGMQPGQVSGVVETQFGYHIIKVTDRKPPGLTPFEKAKPEIVKKLEDMKKGQLFRQYVDKLRAEAKIEYPPGKEPMPMRPRPLLSPPREVEMAPAPK